MSTPTLRETPVPTAPPMPVPRREFQPVRIFVDKDRTALAWFIIALLAVAVAVAEPFYLVQKFKERERVVIVDPAGTYYLSPLFDFAEAKELHAQQTTLATLAFLERSPQGLDHPGLLKQMYLKAAADKAAKQRFSEEG